MINESVIPAKGSFKIGSFIFYVAVITTCFIAFDDVEQIFVVNQKEKI